MSPSAIEVERLSKRYWLGQGLGAHRTLQESLASAIRRESATKPRQEIWALRGVSLSADEGETLGVIGHNGAGKTTLLKILARITRPTAGVSRTRGRVGALIDVGTGFHPELTGRENIFLNGSILGMKRREIRQRFDEIVDFAGLERFLDTPIKRYSWGMYLRLAFAVAAHVEPEVVVVDEVLAVGDVLFREKCLGKMSEFGREGRTVVFVSHDLGSINQVCRRTIWLDQGEVRAEGRSEEVIDQYVRASVARAARVDFEAAHGARVELVSIAVTDEHGQVQDAPRRHEPFTIRVCFRVRERIPGLDVSLSLQNQKGVQVLEEVWGVDTGKTLVPGRVPAEYEAALSIPPILAAGDYVVGVWIGTRYDTFVREQALGFRLWPHPDDGSKALVRDRVVQPRVEWEVRTIEPRPPEDTIRTARRRG
jgi:ABC-2 type transport system ATP-binding protein/lipopolysaccharide transport system ATP-binding protein